MLLAYFTKFKKEKENFYHNSFLKSPTALNILLHLLLNLIQISLIPWKKYITKGLNKEWRIKLYSRFFAKESTSGLDDIFH